MLSVREPATKPELTDALDAVVQAAYENGVNVADGAYELSHEGSIPTWEVQITRMADTS